MADPVNKNAKKKGDYPVGYGKPPQHGRFQPGKSGNPSGKKKGKSLAHYLTEAGETEKTFSLGGQQVSLPANEALAQKLYTDALKGNHQATKLILTAEKAVLGETSLGATTLVGPEEMEVARTHADWLKLIDDAMGGQDNDDTSE